MNDYFILLNSSNSLKPLKEGLIRLIKATPNVIQEVLNQLWIKFVSTLSVGRVIESCYISNMFVVSLLSFMTNHICVYTSHFSSSYLLCVLYCLCKTLIKN